jgi:multidrug efflux pump
VVIASGLAIGTCFTLFVVPAAYVLLASDKRPAAPEAKPVLPAPAPEPAITQ